MSVASPHEILQANYLNFDVYTITECDLWQRDHILMLDMFSLSKFPKMALNSSRNVSKLLNKGDWCSNKGVNQVRAMLDNKVPMNPTWIGLVRYRWKWSWTTKHTWLTKPWNFEHVPSNLSNKLIYGSFGWGYFAEMHPKEVKTWLVCKWATNSWSAWFSCSKFLRITKTSSKIVLKTNVE
jgi:hypothetical protein